MLKQVLRIISLGAVTWIGVFHCQADYEHGEERVTVGAIRWDGWFAGSPWAANLVPAEYHRRLPFYTEWKDSSPVVNADRQEVMDMEIAYARKAGLDYWAFVYYDANSWPDADKYNYGWKRYLASEHRCEINFCLILQGGHLGSADDWQNTVKRLIGFLSEPTYQKVLGDRPLVYMFYVQEFERIFGPGEKSKDAINVMRERAIRSGLGQPYLVAQVFDAAEGASYVERLGFDAIGAYSKHNAPGYTEQREYPYNALAKINRDFWNECKDLNKEVVPLVNAGWDVRPRWHDTELMRQYKGQQRPYFTQPRPLEFAEHLQSAINWVAANKTAARSEAILIYSWNETDEGGWLVPTVCEGSARLDAMSNVLKKCESVK
jgi:hypothetical protein